MKERSDDPRSRVPESPKPAIPIWLALLMPPLAALLHLQLSYPIEHTACSTGSIVQLHGLSVGALLVDATAGWLAHREWVRNGSANPGQLPGPQGSRRLMALLGMLGAGVFALFILAQWFPTFVLPPCIRT